MYKLTSLRFKSYILKPSTGASSVSGLGLALRWIPDALAVLESPRIPRLHDWAGLLSGHPLPAVTMSPRVGDHECTSPAAWYSKSRFTVALRYASFAVISSASNNRRNAESKLCIPCNPPD